MRISQKYSHLNGEEFLIVHHNDIYQEIKDVVSSIDANVYRTKVSQEKRSPGKLLYSPVDINQALKEEFASRGWNESRYSYYITLNRQLMEESLKMDIQEQRKFFIENGDAEPIYSYNQTDFLKDLIAIEVQFGKYAFVAYDLFVKHMLFFSGGKINLGVEILPTKVMQREMSSGIAYFEGEVYNVMRQGRTSPPVPLLILGIEP